MRRRTALVAVVVGMLTAVPVAVYASHQFNDVPNDHTFHSAIDWMADTGITQGCNPPANDEFCPDDPVNRGQMATFLKRFHDRFIGAGGAPIGLGYSERQNSAPASQGNGVVDDLALNLKIPTTGILVITGSVDMVNPSEADMLSCGINTGGSPGAAQGDSWRSLDLTNIVANTCSTTTAVIAEPGNATARMVISGALATTEARGGSISAILYTADGLFGLLDDNDHQTEAPTLSDTPKGG